MQCQRVQTPAVHCHSDVCCAADGHSAGCRTSRVCLQHHATVVTSHGVTVCGSQFPPTVSKHCQHQHSAIHKTIQQYETPSIPAVVISKVLLPQSNITAAFVHSNSSLLSGVSSCLPKYKSHNIRNLNFYPVRSIPADPLTLLLKMSNCQHTAVHFNLSVPHCNVLITLFNLVTSYEC